MRCDFCGRAAADLIRDRGTWRPVCTRDAERPHIDRLPLTRRGRRRLRR